MGKRILPVLLLLFLSSGSARAAVSDITITPDLDISYFDSYTFSANIDPEPSSATLTLQGLSGGSPADWNYYANGDPVSMTSSYSMTFKSGTTWEKTNIRPDHIYPEIEFAPSSTTWYYEPLNMNTRRNNYQIMHFTNPFTLADDMNFWIEFYAEPVSEVNSADLEVYLVEKGHDISFFQSDWRNNLTDIELVGTINRNTALNHTHTQYSKHHLIRLTSNGDKTFGTRSLDISGDFWIVLYNISPNTNRGWNLKYHASPLCENTNGWYRGNQAGWITTAQTGCPDAHIHVARRSAPIDGVRATVTADGATAYQDFTFEGLPPLPPNPTNFTAPLVGVYSGTFNVTWNGASDPNPESVVDYNLYLVDSNSQETTLIEGTGDTSFGFDTTGETDGDYTIRGQACDDGDLCTDFYSQTFSINNAEDIYSLNAITMSSNNSDAARATTGDSVTLSFTSTGTINTPTVAFYSGGASVSNTVTVAGVGNNWTATYQVSANDTSGQVSFTINGTNLDLEYSEVTAGNYVIVYFSSSSQVSSNGSVASNNDPQPNSCNDARPSGIPDLFQIDISDTIATVYYSPTGGVTNYFISYSEKSGEFQHGTETNQGVSGGVLSYKINYLKPNTAYYFRIRGQNGGMPGDFGKEMMVKTRARGEKNLVSYYKGGSNNIINNYVVNVTPAPTVTPEPIKEITQAKEERKMIAELPKKRCFLWWCF